MNIQKLLLFTIFTSDDRSVVKLYNRAPTSIFSIRRFVHITGKAVSLTDMQICSRALRKKTKK